MFEELIQRERRAAVVGLGYVGLPLAVELARKITVVGYDINEARLEQLRLGHDPNGELSASAFEGRLGNTEFRLVSADAVDFRPVRVLA